MTIKTRQRANSDAGNGYYDNLARIADALLRIADALAPLDQTTLLKPEVQAISRAVDNLTQRGNERSAKKKRASTAKCQN